MRQSPISIIVCNVQYVTSQTLTRSNARVQRTDRFICYFMAWKSSQLRTKNVSFAAHNRFFYKCVGVANDLIKAQLFFNTAICLCWRHIKFYATFNILICLPIIIVFMIKGSTKLYRFENICQCIEELVTIIIYKVNSFHKLERYLQRWLTYWKMWRHNDVSLLPWYQQVAKFTTLDETTRVSPGIATAKTTRLSLLLFLPQRQSCCFRYACSTMHLSAIKAGHMLIWPQAEGKAQELHLAANTRLSNKAEVPDVTPLLLVTLFSQAEATAPQKLTNSWFYLPPVNLIIDTWTRWQAPPLPRVNTVVTCPQWAGLLLLTWRSRGWRHQAISWVEAMRQVRAGKHGRVSVGGSVPRGWTKAAVAIGAAIVVVLETKQEDNDIFLQKSSTKSFIS